MRTHSGKKGGFNYLAGLTNLVVVSLVTWFFYHIFLHPEPILKTILIINGLTFEVVFLSIVIMIAYMIGFYPDSIQKLHPISRGVLLLLISILLVVVVYFIIFRNVIGRFGVAYFSPVSILASGGTGAEPLNALMQSSEAILYFHIGFIWMAFLWKLSAGDWPWNDCTHSVVAFSRSITILFVATITYTILFHPVICYLFYPPQNKAAVKPWWGNIASTGSVYFHLGWILCTLAWIIISIFLWEGYPWKLINKEKKGSMVRVGATSLGTLFLGIITMIISMKIMNLFWGEAFPGGQYTDGIDFRYIRAGEICSFFILTTFIVKSHFNNFPNKFAVWGNASIRSAIVIVAGLILYFLYYSKIGELLAGLEIGIGYPVDTPLIFIWLFISIVIVHDDFFQGWPIKKDNIY